MANGQYGPEALINSAGVLVGATVTSPGYVCIVDAKGNLTVTGPSSDAVTLTVGPLVGSAFTLTLPVAPLPSTVAALTSPAFTGTPTLNGVLLTAGGEPAPLVPIPAWVALTSYPTVGQQVTNGGYFWSNKVSHTSGTTFTGTTNWVQLGPVLATADGSAPLAVTAANGTYATVIEHGSTAATARPTGAVRVFWRGSVQPTNIIVGDRYINTSTPAAPTESICTGVGPVVLASLGGTASTVGATPSPITGSGGYDPTKSIYNLTPSSFRKIRAKMATAKAGTGLCRIVCAGTSMTAAFKAETRQDTSGYPAQMRSLLVANGYPVGGTGMVQPNTWNVENFDSRITYTTGWNTTGVPTSGAGTLSSSTVASTLTFVGNVAGTKVDVVYANGSGVFTVAIDGTAAVTVTPSGANNGNAIYTVTGLANTTHTVVVTVSTVTTVFILGFQIVGSTGLLVSNAGVDGSTAQAFSDPNFYTWGTVTTSAPWSPDLYILEGPMNDFLQTIALATTTANYVTAANRAKAAGADVILVIDPASTTINGSDAKWDTYRQAMYNAADTIGCPLIDLTESMGRRTTVITNGLDVDGVHLDSAGYAAMGIAIKVALGI
jgi:lysophospholipase L1-like esterase